MAQYKATLIHGERGGEGTYSFEAPGGLILKSGLSTVRAFMEHVKTLPGMGHSDWHLHSVNRNGSKTVVTAMGTFEFEGSDEQPFVCFISS